MLEYIARRFQNRPAGLALNTEALRRYNDIIDLSIGDTDFTTDKRIIDAAYADALAGHTHYGDPKGDPELIAAVRRAWKEDFDQDISEAEVLITTSSCMGMSQALLGLLNPGDEVIVFGPYFADYRNQIELAGGVLVEVETYAEDGYPPRREALLAAVTPRTRAMIVNTPANPTGAAYDLNALTMLAEVAKERDLLVLADEIYTRYLYDGVFTPMRTLPGMAERTITLNSFSKNFMMTGWRVGYIIAHPELIAVFKAINDALTYAAPSISQRAAIKALELRDDIAEKYITHYRDRVLYSADALAALPYLSVVRPRGTFYVFPCVEKSGMDDHAFCDFLLEKAHILATPGSLFGRAGKNHIRMACTVSDEKIKEAMRRFEAMSEYFDK